tara:strand:- start:2664 stop:2828 length:165 start_codon:yes stop_codon:yes gene_type:complete
MVEVKDERGAIVIDGRWAIGMQMDHALGSGCLIRTPEFLTGIARLSIHCPRQFA